MLMKGDILSGVIVVAIVVSSSILVLNTINPFVQESRDFQSFNEAKLILQTIDSTISQLFFEAPGARRSIDINLREGKFIVSGKDDTIKIRLEGISLFTSGLRTQEGNILITSGAAMNAYESDIDGDDNTDLVLENGMLLFAVKKLGSASSPVSVNTSSIITLMRNKNIDFNVSYPRSGIFINDKETTSYGSGYTELTQLGNSMASGSIHLFLNATAANVTYDATFSLAASQDFIEFQVGHVTGV